MRPEDLRGPTGVSEGTTECLQGTWGSEGNPGGLKGPRWSLSHKSDPGVGGALVVLKGP